MEDTFDSHGTNEPGNAASACVPLNPRKEPLTPEKLRELTGDATISEEEATAIISTIRKLNTLFIALSRMEEQQLAANAGITFSLPTINPLTQNKAA